MKKRWEVWVRDTDTEEDYLMYRFWTYGAADRYALHLQQRYERSLALVPFVKDRRQR